MCKNSTVQSSGSNRDKMAEARRTERGIANRYWQTLPTVWLSIPRPHGSEGTSVLCLSDGLVQVKHIIQHVLDLNPEFAAEYNTLTPNQKTNAVVVFLEGDLSWKIPHDHHLCPKSRVIVRLHSNYSIPDYCHYLKREGLEITAETIQLPESDSEDDDGSYPQCSICLRNIRNSMMKLPCNHTFHARCITTWLDVRISCPVCRKDAK